MGYLRRKRGATVSFEESEEIIEADSDPADSYLAHTEVEAALARLSPEQRVVVLLVDRDGFDYASVAAVLDVPKGTVCSRLVAARAALRATLTATETTPRPCRHRARHRPRERHDERPAGRDRCSSARSRR